jgi:hypothetical protein
MDESHPDDPTFPALSVRQPWADLIVNGIKDIENRAWPTDFRGRLLIHAAMTVEWDDVQEVYELLGLAAPADYQPVAGALLGWTEIVDCVKSHPSRFFHGPYGFVLRNSKRLVRPVPWRGQRGIFQVPAGAVEGGS